MELLFSTLLEQSLTVCWVIPIILLLRFVLRKAPKNITGLLWLVVAFRLICPVSFESDFSLVSQAQKVSHITAELLDELGELPESQVQPTVTAPMDMTFTPVDLQDFEELSNHEATEETTPVSPSETPQLTIPPAEEISFPSRRQMLRIGCGIWLGGLIFMGLYGLISTCRWRRRVRTAVRGEDGVWRCEAVDAPFILGVLRPRIYLPFVLPDGAESYVLAHEQAHLRRRDPLWKCLAFVLLSLYWFHPLVWVSYFLFCRDMELACDARVTRAMDAEGKKAYSRALLACTMERNDPVLCPLSFGEVGVKARIQAVLRKKPGKVFTFTASILCILFIVSCAVDPKEERAWEIFYQQELEHLLLQYGANENYGLQSVDVVDLWQDNIPELVVVRRLDETEHGPPSTVLAIFEYANGEVQHRMTRHFAPGADLRWMRCDEGVRFMALLPSDAHPVVQTMETVTITGEMDGGSYLSVEIPSYIQLDDGRWIEKLDRINKDSRYLTDAENASLLKNAKSLMDQDWNGFLKENYGVPCYQRAYLDILLHLESLSKEPRYSSLVDFNSDGYPELVTSCDDTLYVYQYEPDEGTADIVWTEKLGCPYGEENKRVFGINLTQERPSLIVYFGPNPKSEFIEIYQWDEGDTIRRVPKHTMQAQGDETGRRDRLAKCHHWNTDLTREEYEEMRLQFLQGAILFDTRYVPHSLSGNGYTDLRDLHSCSMELLADQEPPQTVEVPTFYADVLRDLIAQYGLFDAGDGTMPVLGLKYAGIHRLSGEMPQLVTLVNTKDENLALRMTLQVWNAKDDKAQPVYSTRLGAQYQQSDVSYRFALTDSAVLSWHSEQIWDEEILHVASGFSRGAESVQVEVYEARGYQASEENGTLPKFYINGTEVSLGHHGQTVDNLLHSATEYDACWDVSPAGRGELMYLLDAFGIDPDTIAPAVKEETNEEAVSVADGVLQIGAESYSLPDFIGASSPTVQQVGTHLLISAHWNPKHNYNILFDLSTRTFGPPFWGLVLDWQGDDLTTLLYSQWNVLYQYPESAIGEFAQGMDLNGIRVEEAVIDEQWQTVTVVYTDVELQEYREQFLLPDPATLLLAEQLNGRGAAAQYLPFCETPGVLTVNEALAYARYLGDLLGNDISLWRYSSCQARRTPDGSTALTLLQPDWKSKRCLAQTHYLQEDGSFLTSEDHLTDGYAGTQVAEWNGKPLIAVRRSNGCLIMDTLCGDCFVIDLYLWDEPRQNSILVAEGLPLAISFTAVEMEENSGILTLSYITGSAHSEYTTLVFAQVDMNHGTWLETSRQPLPQ